MAAQDVFPKVGGDPLYYSEANRFARGGGFISLGSFGSFGSVFISGLNQTSNPSHIKAEYRIVGPANEGSYVFFVSGASANGSVIATLSTTDYCRVSVTIGSPGSGFIHLLSAGIGAGQTQANVGQNLNDFHAGSPYVIFLSGVAGNAISAYSIQSFRGAV